MKLLIAVVAFSSFAVAQGVSPPSLGSGSSSWGSITGTLSSQSDLQTALNGKAPATSGSGVLKGNGSGGTALATLSDITTAMGYIPENVTNKGAASGYAGLDASALVPLANLPTSVARTAGQTFTGAISAPGITGGFSWQASTANAVVGWITWRFK